MPHNPMNNKSVFTIAFMVIAILVGVCSGIAILMNPTGGISGVSKLITVVSILFAFVNPRLGLFIVALQAIYTDELKRVGVYYGAMSMATVQEILIGPLLTLCALNAGFFVQVFLGRVKMGTLTLVLFAIAPALGLYFLAGGAISGGDSWEKKLYNAGTAGLYTTIIPIAFCYFTELKDWIRFLTFQTLLVVPSALWGIWQYFNGFNSIEWTYALSGLSQVHSGQMLLFDNPRVFGLFGSASAFGCLCIYFTFAAWRTWRIREHRFWFLIVTGILFAALVVSTQRSALISPLLFGVAAICAGTRIRTLAFYGTICITFLAGVWQSTWLVDEGLDKINAAIAVDTNWGNEVLKVSTFSDRLRGWERLKRPETWSLFGTGDTTGYEGNEKYGQDYSHDMINRILMKAGATGLGIVLLTGGLLFYSLNRTIWKLPKGTERSAASLSLGLTAMIILTSAAGGDNFTTTPFNLAIWSVLIGVFVVKNVSNSEESVTLFQHHPRNTRPPEATLPSARSH
jgi:hypothetical protein